jgi:hypothetical protein
MMDQIRPTTTSSTAIVGLPPSSLVPTLTIRALQNDMSHLRYSVFDTSSKTPLKNNHMRIFETAFEETESTLVEARRSQKKL